MPSSSSPRRGRIGSTVGMSRCSRTMGLLAETGLAGLGLNTREAARTPHFAKFCIAEQNRILAASVQDRDASEHHCCFQRAGGFRSCPPAGVQRRSAGHRTRSVSRIAIVLPRCGCCGARNGCRKSLRLSCSQVPAHHSADRAGATPGVWRRHGSALRNQAFGSARQTMPWLLRGLPRTWLRFMVRHSHVDRLSSNAAAC